MIEVEIVWAYGDEIIITNGEKQVTVKKRWFNEQINAGKAKVKSAKVLCVDKLRDKNNNIVSYLLKDTAGNTFEFSPEMLKNSIEIKQFDCINLKLTSDNRLIDKKADTVEVSNINEKPKIVKDILNSVIQMKRKDANIKESSIIAYIKKQEKKANVSTHDEIQSRIYKIMINQNEIARLQKIVMLTGIQDVMLDEYTTELTQKLYNYYMKASILYEALFIEKMESPNTPRVMYNENKAYIDEFKFTSQNQSVVNDVVITNALEGRYTDWFYKVCRGEHKVIVFGDVLNRLDYALLEYIGLGLVKADKELREDYESRGTFCVELLMLDISDENIYKALKEKALELREDYQYLDFIRGLAEAINEK